MAALAQRPDPTPRLSARARLQRMFTRLACLLVLVIGALAATGTSYHESDRETDFVDEGGEDGEWSESTDDDARSTRHADLSAPPCERGVTRRRVDLRAAIRLHTPPTRRWILPRRVPPDEDDGDGHA